MARDLKPTAMDKMLEDLASNFTQEKYIHAMAHDYKRARDLPKAITGIHFSRCMNWHTDARNNLNIAIQKTESNIAGSTTQTLNVKRTKKIMTGNSGPERNSENYGRQLTLCC